MGGCTKAPGGLTLVTLAIMLWIINICVSFPSHLLWYQKDHRLIGAQTPAQLVKTAGSPQMFTLTDAPSTLIQALPRHLHLHLEVRKPEQRSQVTCLHCMAHIKKIKKAFFTFIYLMCVCVWVHM